MSSNLCCSLFGRRSKLPAEVLQYYLVTPSLEKWIFELSGKFSPKKQRFLPFTFNPMISKTSVALHPVWKTLCSKRYWRPNPLLLDIVLHSRNVKKVKKWQQPVSDPFGDSDKVFSELYFSDNGLNIELPTTNSPPLSEQNQFWRFYHWLQR